MSKNKRCDSLNIAVNIDYLGKLEYGTKEAKTAAVRDNVMNNIRMTRELSMDYRKSLSELIAQSNMTYTDISNEVLGNDGPLISSDAVGKIINGDTSPKPGTLILICCALRLPYNVSYDILRKANCLPQYYNWDKKNQKYDDAYAIVDQIMLITAGQKASVFLYYLDMLGVKIEKKSLNFHL